ncbi:hypothetical protein COX05_04165 [candidate division WWE3 bacterium CG22_combo_CG10-13_8_21_14_all_39_12]|uniref:Type I restriction modification DNA specificity domain-containing protein n=1 Tax=candidate division WWE3 bacterium CG22_combo_CG10-13_8_21_14_all_39_12 TaxID=1975094 RepID=A0A2H0BEY3_UNCKA|nr:MAG: hypothetical protein COX05_04165 [candidate division WWE3 bacterium CG22_combo_CG10-13_8_21_14_all_39_12]
MQYSLCMYVKLNEIANLISGYSFRSALNSSKEGVRVLQAKDIRGSEITDTTKMSSIEKTFSSTNSYVQENDILLTSRGASFGSFPAAIFVSKETGVIASSSVYILRIKDTTLVLPDYISYYFNSFYGQKKLIEIARGSRIKNIPLKELAEITIPIPSLEKQCILANLSHNIIQQRELNEKRNIILGDLSDTIFREPQTL